MTRNGRNHIPQTNLGHHMDGLQSNYSHKISVTQLNYDKLSLHPQDDFKTKNDNEYSITKQGPNTETLQTLNFVHRLCFEEVKDLVKSKNGQACL